MFFQILTSQSSFFAKNKEIILNNFKKKIRLEFIYNSNKIKKDASFVSVISYYKKILPKDLKKNQNIFVIHESNLPKGRGMSPLFNQILNGKEKIVTTIFRCNRNLDDGPIIYKKTFSYPKNLIYEEIKKFQMKNSIYLIKILLDFFQNNRFSLIKQFGKPSYFKKIPDSINELDINRSIKSQINIIRTRDKKNFRAYFIYKKRKFYLSIIPEKKIG